MGVIAGHAVGSEVVGRSVDRHGSCCPFMLWVWGWGLGGVEGSFERCVGGRSGL